MSLPKQPKKERSRAYPLVDLKTADEILRGPVKTLGTASFDRQALAKALGYSSAEGGVAARKIGALVQYGLLDRHTKLFQISLLGRRLQSLAPADPGYHLALGAALERPALFRQILRRYRPVGRLPENLARILVQDYGITARACAEAEAVFVRSAWFADVLDEEGRLRDQPKGEPTSPPQSLESPPIPSPSYEPGTNPYDIPLTAGRRATLEFPAGMTREDLVWLERRLRQALKEGALWAFLAFEKPADASTEPANAVDEPSSAPKENPNNLVPFSNRPGNQAS